MTRHDLAFRQSSVSEARVTLNEVARYEVAAHFDGVYYLPVSDDFGPVSTFQVGGGAHALHGEALHKPDKIY